MSPARVGRALSWRVGCAERGRERADSLNRASPHFRTRLGSPSRRPLALAPHGTHLRTAAHLSRPQSTTRHDPPTRPHRLASSHLSHPSSALIALRLPLVAPSRTASHLDALHLLAHPQEPPQHRAPPTKDAHSTSSRRPLGRRDPRPRTRRPRRGRGEPRRHLCRAPHGPGGALTLLPSLSPLRTPAHALLLQHHMDSFDIQAFFHLHDLNRSVSLLALSSLSETTAHLSSPTPAATASSTATSSSRFTACTTRSAARAPRTSRCTRSRPSRSSTRSSTASTRTATASSPCASLSPAASAACPTSRASSTSATTTVRRPWFLCELSVA